MKPFHLLFYKLFLINALVFFLLVSGTCPLYSQTANGLNFDGVDDRCTIGDNAAYNLGTGNFTFEAWVKVYTPQPNASPGIFYRKNGNGFSVFLSSIGQLGFNIAGSYAFFGSADIDDNVCHHIAVVRSSVSAVSVYLDGVLKGTTTGVNYGSISTNVGITIGYGAGFKGWIHEVRFWNVARTQTQIQNSKNGFLVGNETGLIGYWRMNEGSGQAINDLSPTNNDGFLGTVNTTDAADPVFVSNSCMCPNPVITSTGGSVCAGQNPTLSAAAVSGYLYQWRLNTVNISGATSQTYIATTAGNYSCQASAFGCSGISNSINLINGSSPATITAGGSVTFCTPNNVVLSANTGTLLSYQWKLNGGNIGGATSSTYIASASGNYSCAVTNNCGSSNSNTITVTVNQSPVASISAGGTTTFCTGGSVLLTAAAGTGYAYQWRLNGNNISGAVSQTYSASVSGNYTEFVTSGSCTATSNSVTVAVHQPLSTTISESTTLFCPSTARRLDVSPQGTGYFYQWFEDSHLIPGANSSQFLAGHNGNYSCTITNTCGSYPSQSFVLWEWQLTLETSGAVYDWGSPHTFCQGGAIGFFVVDDSRYINFQWYKDGAAISGATDFSYTATQTGTYQCQMTDWSCSQVLTSNYETITVNPLPSAAITPNGSTTFCSGGSVTLSVPSGANKIYQWKKNGLNISGATASSYNTTTGGSFKVAVTNSATGCNKTTPSPTIVTVNPLPAAIITPQGPTTFCAGGSVVLKANSGTGYTYRWKRNSFYINGATNINYTATTAGTYKVEVTNTSVCSKTSNGVAVTVPCRENESVKMGEGESAFAVKVYPNPSSGDFVFEIENAKNEKISVNVYDMIGTLVLSGNIFNSQFKIRNPQLIPGIYSAIIANGKNKQVMKLVKVN